MIERISEIYQSVYTAVTLVFYLPFSGSSMKSDVHTEEKPTEARVRNIF